MVYGWSFPIGIDPRTGRIKTNDLAADIRQSIKILLETRKGERIGRPDYGSEIDTYMFENMGKSLIADIKHDVATLIRFWEKRVDALDINIKPDKEAACLLVSIGYRIKASEQTDELIYEIPMK